MTKILHTSDWHIGRTLYGRKRYDEFEAFLNWLAETIDKYNIDALLVAGDIFDSAAPSNRAQELYYRFLCRIGASSCRHVVVAAGNHDSPSFLDAPKELLKALDVHVVGSISDSPENEVLVLRSTRDLPELIVCAVPYLRDRDIRAGEANESVEDKQQKLIDGVCNHYAAVADFAQKKRKELGGDIPIIAMGHLFTAGGQTIDGDGVRELYIGSLAHVTAGIFSPSFDYVALGHLHVPQKVNGSDAIRYSGSPLPMGFGEAGQKKSVCLVEFKNGETTVRLIDVPRFRHLERIQGDWETISNKIIELSATGTKGWVEVVYQGDAIIGDLRERLEAATADTQMEILRVKNNRIVDRVLGQMEEAETLEDLNANEVFERCLAINNVPEDQRSELLDAYRETLTRFWEEDTQAE